MKSNTIDIESIIETASEMRSSFQFAQAAELLNEAVASCGKEDWREKLAIADCFKSIHRVDRSLQIGRELLETVVPPDSQAMIRCRLAVYFEIVGEFSQAEEEINQCIDIHPDALEPQIVLARILGHQGEHVRTVRLLKHVLAEYQPKDAKAVIRVFYQLAHAYDAMAMYDDAFEWALKAKAVQRRVPGAADLARNGMQLLSRLLNTATATRAVGNAPRNESHFHSDALPFQPVHLLGFPRSGTTLLGELLGAHPDIHVSSELPIMVEQIIPKLQPRGIFEKSEIGQLDKLRRLYSHCHLNAASNSTPRILIDKKPANLPFIRAMLELLPSSRFLIALRDPRDVIASCFLRFFPLTDMSANFLSLGTGCIYYAAYMQIYRTLKPLLSESNCMQIRYEQLCESTDKTICNALAFLDCDSTGQELEPRASGKYIHSPTFADVRKPIGPHRCGRWKNYEKYFQPYLRILDPIAAELGY